MSKTEQPADRPPVPGADIEFPEVKMHLHLPGEPCTGRVVANELCTQKKAAGFVRHITIDVSGTALEGNLLPGQSFGVIPPGNDTNGRPNKVRLYSVASPTRGEDGQGRIVATTVKRTIEEHWETGKLFLGVASNYLCDAQPGDEIRLSGPNGKRFILPKSPADHDYLFLATGTGIAPFRGMLYDLLESGVKSRITLILGVTYASDLLYHGELLRLAQQHPNFTYLTALSRERQADGHDPMYVHDRLRTNLDDLLPLLSGERTLIYLCGVAGMELGVFQEMARHLSDRDLAQYLHIDREDAGEIATWSRRMINRAIRPTKRVFMEVYA